MKVAVLLALLCAIVGSVIAQPGSGNPQQQLCAKPPQGCASQMRDTSCINWHGCKWSCGTGNKKCQTKTFGDGTTGIGCKSGQTCCGTLTAAECANKPFRVPTASPTKPTRAPSKAPTFICVTPNNGCPSVAAAATCNGFNGCVWNTVNKQCQIGGCSGTLTPTRSPTTCVDLPAAGSCGSVGTAATCGTFSCCKWQSNKCVSKDVPPPVACSTLNAANCKKRTDCRVSGNKCIARGSG